MSLWLRVKLSLYNNQNDFVSWLHGSHPFNLVLEIVVWKLPEHKNETNSMRDGLSHKEAGVVNP